MATPGWVFQTACVLATIENYAGYGRRSAVQPAGRDPTGGLGAGDKHELKVTPDTLHTVARIFSRRN